MIYIKGESKVEMIICSITHGTVDRPWCILSHILGLSFSQVCKSKQHCAGCLGEFDKS